jgi:hypothetical protein
MFSLLVGAAPEIVAADLAAPALEAALSHLCRAA